MALLVGGIALYDHFKKHGQTLTETVNVTTKMVINATTNIATDCFEAVEGSQVVNIQGNGTAFINADPSPCQMCLDKLNRIYQARMKLEEDAQLANSSYTAQVANPILVTEMSTGFDPTVPAVSATAAPMGACTAMCFDLVVFNVTQSQNFNSNQRCSEQNDVTNDISQSVSGQISSYLKNQQDIFGQLEDAFTNSTSSITSNLATDLTQNITNNFIQTLSQQLSNAQFINVSGNSIVMDQVSQSFSGTQIGSLQVNNTVVDQLRQSATYSVSQSLLNKNDTIGDLTGDFLQVIKQMSELLESLTTQLLMIIGAVLVAIMLVLSSLYLFNKDFHNWTNTAVKSVGDAGLEMLRQKAAAKKAITAFRQANPNFNSNKF
jgi:hypothetical protein